MQAPTIEKLPGSKVKLSFVITPEDAQPYVDQAVEALSLNKPIQGFRPGKAPYAEVAKAMGEMTIWEHALELVVRASYMRAIIDHDLDTIGSPEVQVDSVTPKQEMRFTVIAPVSPVIEKLADYTKERVTFNPRNITEEEMEKAVQELRRMQRKEVVTKEPATRESAVVIDLEIKKDNVILEEGTARGYRIYLNEDHYIPGFTDKLIGIKEGEERTFTLPFPESHYQKHLAGKDVDFSAKATAVFTVELPELNDEFAKTLGQPTLAELKAIVRRNMELEEEDKARDKSEIELLEKLTDDSTFGDIPELLINDEVRKMISEMEHGVEDRGMKMEDYLASIKKTRDELKLEFVPQAMRRIKAATLIKEVSKRENVRVSDEELDTEIDHILSGLREDDKETRARIVSPEYREYVSIMMRNRKALDILRKHGISGYPEEEKHECHDEHCDHHHG